MNNYVLNSLNPRRLLKLMESIFQQVISDSRKGKKSDLPFKIRIEKKK